MPIPDALIEAMAGLSDSALRSLLGLIRLSFRFDPETSTWVCPDRTFSRAEIQAECGLSGQGTRDGLSELEAEGYVRVGRSGRSHEHVLEIGVPSSRFTYVPTGLFEEAPGLSGTELRVTLAVLRATWGWTTNADGAETGAGEPPEHKRWARLTTPNLSQLTGRSESAVKQAARELQGTWLQRRRPQGGAFYYRFRTEVITLERLTSERLTTETGPNERGSGPGRLTVEKRAQGVFSMGIPNDLPPDRQQSGPPRRENIERDLETSAQHTASTERKRTRRNRPPSRSEGSAVPGGENPSRNSAGPPAPRSRPEEARPEEAQSGWGSGRSSRDPGPGSAEELDLAGVSGRKRRLGQKLANAGVWPRRIPELLARYSAERIEANFQLYRKRAQQVRKSGAWLAAAIEEGYALPVQVGEHQPGESQPGESQPGERPPSRHSPSGHSPSGHPVGRHPVGKDPANADPAGGDPVGADSTGKAPAESGGRRYGAGGPKAKSDPKVKSGPKAESRPAGGGEGRAPGLPPPGTKVSESRKRRLVRAGVAAEADFEKFADYDDPDRKQHFYRVEKTPSRARPSPAARA